VDSCGERAASAQYPEVVKSTVRSLLSHMRVFAAFQDLKSAHRQAELREKVEGLLSHRLNQVSNVCFFPIQFVLTRRPARIVNAFLAEHQERKFSWIPDPKFSHP
jgi:hypothetical protein